MIAVSVCITTYNLEKYILETLESVLAQKTDFEYEILIGDDGSSDATLDIVHETAQRCNVPISIHVMERIPNRKYNPIMRASRNRLNLTKYARGKYITFLDGDDLYVNPYMLQKTYDVLEKNDDCVMCGGDFFFFYENKKSKKRIIGKKIQEGKMNKGQYWDQFWIHAECFLYRNVFREQKHEVDVSIFDDNLIVYYFMKYGEMYYINDVFVAYRQNETPWKQKSLLEKNYINAMSFLLQNAMQRDMFLHNCVRHCNNYVYLFNHITDAAKHELTEIKQICKKEGYKILNLILKYPNVNIFEYMILSGTQIFFRVILFFKKLKYNI